MPVRPGDRLGNYQLVESLARGGMGQVWRAIDVRTDRQVALKILADELLRNEVAVARFEREARAIATLQHPNVVTLFEFDRFEGVPFVVTELLTGETLRTWIEVGKHRWSDSVSVAISIARGLEAAHAKGVIHRDLKPENVFLTKDGGLKLLDFGLARLVDEDESETIRKGDTEPGTLIGTVRYMSPEQARGETVTPASDVFSLGTILYEMLTGVAPFERASLTETLVALMMSDPSPPGALATGIPDTLGTVVMEAIRRDPRKRVSSATELIARLEKVVEHPGAPSAKRAARSGVGEPNAIDSIAVLPFQAANRPAQDYLGDGFTETLIYALSDLPRLRVMAPSTVFHYRDRDPLVAGHELGVRAVVTGKIMPEGEALSVRVELIDADDGSLLWGELFLGSRALLSAVHREIAIGISRALRPGLSSSQRKLRASRTVPERSDAYRNYLRGRHQWNRRTPQALREAIELFEKAIQEEPGFAPAWSGMADCYSLLCFYRALRPFDGFQRARAAAEKALSHDPILAEAHASIGYIELMYDWDLVAASNAFENAIRLNPNYPTAHHWFSHVFEAAGDHDRALAEIRLAQELDPLSTVIDEIIGFHLISARRWDDARVHLSRILELDPRFARTWFDLADLHFLTGEPDKGVELEIEGLRHLAGAPVDVDRLERAWAAGGVTGYLEDNLAQVREKEGYRSPVEELMILIRLGRQDEVLTLLEQAKRDRCDVIVFLGRPNFDSLRDEPRFQTLRS